MKQFRDTHYLVSENGSVYGRNKGGKLIKLKPRIYKGYAMYNLRLEYGRGKSTCFLGHRIVGEVYLNDWNPKLTINHKDYNKLNNHYSNLEMMTLSDNLKDRHNHFHNAFQECNKNKKGKTYYELYPDKAETLINNLKKKRGKRGSYKKIIK